jgi:protein transport protein SEC61 subunit alpha
MSSGGFRILHVVRPFLFLLPEVVPVQGRKVPFREKALYTTVALAIFLICSQCVPGGELCV